ncbi:MAG TPA: DUF2624 family protein [Tenericutes bacterium]|nr:DUF2624 family protein [Mycoplasmatota bacterium]
MKEKLIKQYVDKISPNDIDSFARKHGTTLNNDEKNIIYNYIKRDWHTIIYGNPTGIFNEIKSKVSTSTYKKIEELFKEYKNKFRNYL